MPLNPRVRGNNVFGTTTDSPLTAGSATMNSLGLSNLPVVISQHATITLDPLRQFGNPEIVVVTNHTSGATVASITRGTYGTSSREHPSGTLWVHAPLDEDFTEIVTSSTRPLDPYRGQMIFESDTDKFVARSQSDTWVDAVPLGAWQSWTPSFTNFTPGGATITGRYYKIGRTVSWYLKVILSGSTMGSSPTFSLPVQMSSLYNNAFHDIMGWGWAQDAGTAHYGTFVNWATSTTVSCNTWRADTAFIQAAGWTVSQPFTWTNTDSFTFTGSYEAVS